MMLYKDVTVRHKKDVHKNVDVYKLHVFGYPAGYLLSDGTRLGRHEKFTVE